jgi:hypothetical protein
MRPVADNGDQTPDFKDKRDGVDFVCKKKLLNAIIVFS